MVFLWKSFSDRDIAKVFIYSCRVGIFQITECPLHSSFCQMSSLNIDQIDHFQVYILCISQYTHIFNVWCLWGHFGASAHMDSDASIWNEWGLKRAISGTIRGWSKNKSCLFYFNVTCGLGCGCTDCRGLRNQHKMQKPCTWKDEAESTVTLY